MEINAKYVNAKDNQPTINIGMIGSVSNGKSSITEKITGIKTQKHSKEQERNITIKLGYANAKIFKCDNCPSPQCYQPHHSSIMTANCRFCDEELRLDKHISLIDCFDPETLVLMYDGSTKKISDLKINEELIGPDGIKRTISKIMEGEKDMYEINYLCNSKKSLDKNKFVCTKGHLLVLRIDTPVECPVNKFKSRKFNTYEVRIYGADVDHLFSKCHYFGTMEEALKFYDSQNKDPIIFEMTVEAFLNSPVTIKKKARLFYSKCLEFENHQNAMDISINGITDEEVGWLIGLWLGDGTSVNPEFSIGFNDPEIIDKLKLIANKIDLICIVEKCTNEKKAYRVVLSTNSGKPMYTKEKSNENKKNPLTIILNKLGIFKNKHIGDNLKFQKKTIRCAIVAGLIDSDGYYGKGQFEITQSIDHKPIVDGLIWILRSLGFRCHYSQKYNISYNEIGEKIKTLCYKVTFNGKASDLPVCLPRKFGKDIIRNWTTSQPFSVKPIGLGKYMGFEVDGDGRFLLSDFIVAHNCPGHNLLMATMLNGTCVMDTTILVESASNKEPTQQTKEHLFAIGMIGLENSIVCLNKLDLVKKEVAVEKMNILQQYLKNTKVEKSPIVPVAANYGINIDVVCEYICKYIKEPLRDFDGELKMVIIRSFNINKQEISYENIEGGVIGGTIMRGVININDKVCIYPGVVSKNSDNDCDDNNKKCWSYKPLVGTVLSINSETNTLEYAIPGGLIGIKLDIDPGIATKDGLVGNIVTSINNTEEYKIFESIFVELELLDRTEFNNITTKDILVINSNACNNKCEVIKIKKDKAELKLLEKPICVKINDYVTLSKNNSDNILIVGRAKILDGFESLKK